MAIANRENNYEHITGSILVSVAAVISPARRGVLTLALQSWVSGMEQVGWLYVGRQSEAVRQLVPKE